MEKLNQRIVTLLSAAQKRRYERAARLLKIGIGEMTRYALEYYITANPEVFGRLREAEKEVSNG